MSSHLHHRHPSPFGAGLRSLLLPGWGQVAARGATIGWVLIGASLGLLVVAVVGVRMLGTTELLARLADPKVLTGVLLLNAALGLTRLAATTHAWWSAGGRNVLVVLILAIVVIAPHAAVGWVGGEARATLVGLFGPSIPPTVVTPVPTTTTTTTSTTTTTTTVPATTTPPPTTSTTLPPTTTTTTTTLPPVRFEDRLNILLLGGDAGPGRPGLRTDTIMVASIDPATGEAALFGIPRNFGGITFSDGSPFPGRLVNEVYQWGLAHPNAFGGVDPGASAVRDVVEHLTGLEIDHFALVDLTGFGALVDAFGGVTIDVPADVDAPLYDPRTGGYTMITIKAGPRHLDGPEALAYARSRTGSDDYTRMGRQRCLLAAMVSESSPVSLVPRLPQILEAIRSHITTDIPIDLVPDLLRLLPLVDADQIRVVGFDRSWRSGWTDDRVAIPDIPRIRAAIHATITDPAQAGTVGVGTAGDAC